VASVTVKEEVKQSERETLSLRSIKECFKGEQGQEARFGCSQLDTGLRGEQDFEGDERFRASVIGEFGDARRSALANSGLARREAGSRSRASDEGEESQRPEEDRSRVLAVVSETRSSRSAALESAAEEQRRSSEDSEGLGTDAAKIPGAFGSDI
jgi:hypothetical protein